MKRALTLKAIAAATLFTACTLPASANTETPAADTQSKAAPELVTIAEPEFVREMARGYGSARVSQDATGDPMVAGKANGLGYSVFFYGCEKKKDCNALQFHSSFDMGKPVKLSLLNAWNVKKRYVKAELNDKGFAVVHLDYPFMGGVTRDNMDSVMNLWVMLLDEFATHVGYRK